jgi:3-dehydro-4-phosphotetronate decarboxylase
LKTEAQYRQEICRIGQSLFERGFVIGSAGNISVRLPNQAGFLITPTDACLGNLEPDLLALVDASGIQKSGNRASKTLMLHRKIYDANPDAHCVIHTHSTNLVALSLSGVWQKNDVLPPITPYFVMKVGHVPLIPYHVPGEALVAELIAEKIAAFDRDNKDMRAVLLERLGPVVWHQSLEQASATLEELEETAELWLRTKALPLSQEQLNQLCQQFKVRW